MTTHWQSTILGTPTGNFFPLSSPEIVPLWRMSRIIDAREVQTAGDEGEEDDDDDDDDGISPHDVGCTAYPYKVCQCFVILSAFL